MTAPAGRSRIRRRPRQLMRPVITYALLIVAATATALPLVFMIRSSLMGPAQIFSVPVEWLPDPVLVSNYPDAVTTIPFMRYLANTVVIVVLVVAGTVITATVSAYGFSRLRWPGRDIVFYVLLTTLMVPYAVTLVPTFLLWSQLGLNDTIAPLTVPAWFGGHVFFVFLLRQFFRTIPLDLDEAAALDGANPLQILWYVIVPLSRPALITVAIFSGLTTWNDFLGPLVYLTDSNDFTLALGLAQFTGQYTNQWGLLMAASTLVVAPVVILFFIAQRYFMEGISLTGVRR